MSIGDFPIQTQFTEDLFFPVATFDYRKKDLLLAAQ